MYDSANRASTTRASQDQQPLLVGDDEGTPAVIAKATRAPKYSIIVVFMACDPLNGVFGFLYSSGMRPQHPLHEATSASKGTEIFPNIPSITWRITWTIDGNNGELCAG